MRIAYEKDLVVMPGEPKAGVSCQPTSDGYVIFALTCDGRRILALASPEEATALGISFIEASHAARIQTKPAIQVAQPNVVGIVNGAGRG
ncbi:MAG TPA: hypothetical protein VM925_21760 [Labilithrix sp.]|jgi:hypothetical protein|nr:hypothetical protein [Labilithrix sp.]